MSRPVGSRNKPHEGHYRERNQWRFRTKESIESWGGRRGGWAVLHRPTPLFDGEVYYTWHKTKKGALKEFGSGPMVADEQVIQLVKLKKVKRVAIP